MIRLLIAKTMRMFSQKKVVGIVKVGGRTGTILNFISPSRPEAGKLVFEVEVLGKEGWFNKTGLTNEPFCNWRYGYVSTLKGKIDLWDASLELVEHKDSTSIWRVAASSTNGYALSYPF